MNPLTDNKFVRHDLPKAIIKEKTRISFIWIVPVVAAIIAGWLVFKYFSQNGPVISILFDDGNEIAAHQTTLRYRGVKVGEVLSVGLTSDIQQVQVNVRLNRAAKTLAREGSVFWIVRPELGSGGLHGLETIVSGPYIQVQPGNGNEARKFIGAAEAPIIKPAKGGLEFIVTTPQLGALNMGSPIYYRGLEVGSVQYFVLGKDATQINVHILVETNFANLVRINSQFWNAGGIDFNLKLFGINISAESFKALIMGGIAFATPPLPGPLATNGTSFPLHEKVEEQWLKWSPAITISNSITPIKQSPPSSLLFNNLAPR